MLRNIRIQNYRCLRDVEVNFTPLTALVGPNGSGKTAILDAIRVPFSVPRGDVWRQRADLIVSREGEFNDAPFAHRLGPDSQVPGEWSFDKLAIRPHLLRTGMTVEEAHRLEENGQNIVNVFATLPRRKKEQIASQLRDLVPIYEDLDARPQASGRHRLVFQDRWDHKVWYEPSQVSEGTLVLLTFLLLAHLENPPHVLGIEEPEQALHPFLVGEVVRALRLLAKGELGPKPVQVVLTTHSAQLLNFLQPEEVRFVSRSLEDGGTVIRSAPTDSTQWQAAYSEYQESLGDMWLSGGLGGVPGVAPTQ